MYSRVMILSGFLVLMFSACTDDVFDWDLGSSTDDVIEVDDDDNVDSELEDKALIHEEDSDYTWEENSEITITLNGNSIQCSSSNVLIENSLANISAPGNYRIIGSLDDGQIRVNTEEEGVVRMILDQVTINNSSSAAIFVVNADKSIIVLPEGTQNTLSDGQSYVFDSADEDEPNATLFSKDDLTLFGEGTLNIQANYADAIAGKDGVILASGEYHIEAKDDGIRGKDYLLIHSGEYNIDAGGDALKSTNDEDTSVGFLQVNGGTFTIESGADALQAKSDLLIKTATVYISDAGAKGLKAGSSVVIDAGSFNITSDDDAIHTNNKVTINSGDFVITS
jgi:hypothetical protein